MSRIIITLITIDQDSSVDECQMFVDWFMTSVKNDVDKSKYKFKKHGTKVIVESEYKITQENIDNFFNVYRSVKMLEFESTILDITLQEENKIDTSLTIKLPNINFSNDLNPFSGINNTGMLLGPNNFCESGISERGGRTIIGPNPKFDMYGPFPGMGKLNNDSL